MSEKEVKMKPAKQKLGGSDNLSAPGAVGDGQSALPFYVGAAVLVYAGTNRQTSGNVVEDFGEFIGEAVHVNNTRIAEPARRWAINLGDGGLVFVDTEDLLANDIGEIDECGAP